MVPVADRSFWRFRDGLVLSVYLRGGHLEDLVLWADQFGQARQGILGSRSIVDFPHGPVRVQKRPRQKRFLMAFVYWHAPRRLNWSGSHPGGRFLQCAGGVPAYDGTRGHIASHNGPGGNDCSVTNGYTFEDDCFCADPNMISDGDWGNRWGVVQLVVVGVGYEDVPRYCAVVTYCNSLFACHFCTPVHVCAVADTHFCRFGVEEQPYLAVEAHAPPKDDSRGPC